MIIRFPKVLIVAAFLIIISACDKKSCKNITCASGLECISAKCVCADGTEGTGCTTDSYVKYVRNQSNWTVSESCSPVTQFGATNSVFIAPNTTNKQLISIYNLFTGQCSPIVAGIYTNANNEGNTLQIPQQNCPSGTISGTGSFDDATGRIYLQLDYLVSNGTDYQCTETLYPQ